MIGVLFMFIPFLVMVALFIGQAVWVANDSRKRDDEYWWLWTIAALISCPIGIIVYILVTRMDRNKCKICGKEVPKNIKTCPYCGSKCGETCANCGCKVQPGWKYCPNCSVELTDIKDNR